MAQLIRNVFDDVASVSLGTPSVSNSTLEPKMYYGSAIARSRLKWLVVSLLVMFFLYCLTKQNNEFNRGIDEIEKIDEMNSKKLYYVYNEQCKIPYIDPFAKEALDIFKPMKFETCTNDSDLIKPIFDENIKRYILHIDESVAAKLLNSSDIEYNCYYQEITRNAEHDSYEDLPPRIYFSQGYVVPLHVEGMIVGCSEAANDTNVLQTDAYGFIQQKKDRSGVKSERRKPSVIMFGIDSISRINLRRTMPKVHKYLTKSGWHEMQGYNKVADNTFPNLMAILSGYTPDTAKAAVCDTAEVGCFDRFPFIWKYLHNAGYLTAYGEDACGLNTFNYLRPGFQKPPTDYYYRPMLKAFESEMKTWVCADCTLTYCIGRRIQSSYVYDYGAEFARRYVKQQQPVWGLFWSSSFSHDDFAMPSKMEEFILQYLLDFERDDVFEENIVIFFADHGSRYGELMSLSSGFLEERLPMLFIYLPPWFRAAYPDYVNALKANTNRLTSNFDLHNTLKHIIELGNPTNAPTLPKANDCPKCQSLFHPVNATRTCSDAGIPEHYCTCIPYKRITYAWSDRIALGVIDRINEYLGNRSFGNLCTNLTLSYIHKTEVKIGLELNFHDKLPRMDVGLYRTKFKVQQNSADFFATVIFNNLTGFVDVDVETISRTSSYEEDSTCIDDKIAKLYCICQSDLKP